MKLLWELIPIFWMTDRDNVHKALKHGTHERKPHALTLHLPEATDKATAVTSFNSQ